MASGESFSTDGRTYDFMTQRLMRVRDGEERRLERYVWASGVLKVRQSPPLEKARGEEAW